MVQPDVLMVCDRERIHMNCVYGAPDFIVEIMSKTTRKKDSILKLNKYMNAGVREYWMVDPESRKAVSYTHLDVYKRQGRGICGGGILYWKVRAAASLDILMTGRNMDKEDAVPFEKN